MKKIFRLFIVLVLFLIATPIPVKADTGPKPALTIIVKGIGDEYCLDLLVTGSSEYMWLKISDEEREKAKKLSDYSEDGFHAALLKGTDRPMNGSIFGVKQPDGSYIHKFSYMGVPTEFKIAILKNDGTLIVSDIIKRKDFQSVMEYSITNNKGTVREISSKKKYLFGFFIRLVVTLLIEFGIALLFGFTLKKSWKVLLITNILTQIILNIIIIKTPNVGSGVALNTPYIFGEILVVFIELIVYSKYLIEQKLNRRVIYTIFANAISLFLGFVLLFIS